MPGNYPKLNAYKTELSIIRHPQQVSTVQNFELKIGDSILMPQLSLEITVLFSVTLFPYSRTF